MNEALRILHVAPTPFFSDRGCHIRIEGIVKGLGAKGVENLVCTYHHGRERPGVETRRIDPMDGYEDTQAGPNAHKYMADIKLFRLVCQCVRKHRPHIIHAHLHEGVLLGWAAKWALMKPRLPLVADLQGSLVGELDSYNYFEKSNSYRLIFKCIERSILRMPGHIFCSSVSGLALFQDEYKLSKERSTLLSDRVEKGVISTNSSAQLRREPAVVYSGSLLESKGLSQLLQSLERLLLRRADVRVILIGYPTQDVAAHLQRKGLGDRCLLTGRIHYEDLPGHLAGADIGLDPKLPGAGEGSGKILNYMAAGLPVVAFDSANNREFLGQGQYLVPDASIEDFVARIEYLIDHPQVRQQEGERNRQRVMHELTWDAGVDIVLARYDKMLGHNRANPVGTRSA